MRSPLLYYLRHSEGQFLWNFLAACIVTAQTAILPAYGSQPTAESTTPFHNVDIVDAYKKSLAENREASAEVDEIQQRVDDLNLTLKRLSDEELKILTEINTYTDELIEAQSQEDRDAAKQNLINAETRLKLKVDEIRPVRLKLLTEKELLEQAKKKLKETQKRLGELNSFIDSNIKPD